MCRIDFALCVVHGMWMVTAEAVKAARERLQESQETFAKRFGVDQSTVHRWETDGVPQRGTAPLAVERVLADIAAELSVSTVQQ